MWKRPLEALRNDTSDIFEPVRGELSGSGADIDYKEFIKHWSQKVIFVEGTMWNRLLSN